MSPVDDERAGLKRSWPREFRDGERSAFLQRYDGTREPGGYPLGFHQWLLERRNAWYCGHNIGLLERLSARLELADG
jgi:hypothetical protein